MVVRSLLIVARQQQLLRSTYAVRGMKAAHQTRRKLTKATPNDSVWKLKNVEASYWDEYIATRPAYEGTVFDPIFSYHTTKGLPFEDALDVGTGAGSALEPLLNRFARVAASDNDPVSSKFTQDRFHHIPKDRLSFTLSKGEELDHHHAPSSFDMITCALTFPLLETEKALRCMFNLLRPGGTLAILFYGPPFFVDSRLAAEAQPILYAALDRAFKPVVCGGDIHQTTSWKRAADGMASWLDYIPFAKQEWQDVRRHKWNTRRARLAFFGSMACDFEIEPTSAVDDGEILIEEQNPWFWRRYWDIDMVKRFVAAVFPAPKGVKMEDPEMEGYFKSLDGLMGGPGKVFPMSWPAVLILATKNHD